MSAFAPKATIPVENANGSEVPKAHYIAQRQPLTANREV
jgi:hypothetical protein